MSWGAGAKGLYLTNDAFYQQAFDQQPCDHGALWIREQRKQAMQQILGRNNVGLRQRYCRNDEKTAWIFNEVGKELPITIGVVVLDEKIEKVVVLAYRESRGAEIRHEFFTRQFYGQSLLEDNRLSQSIDGITGATLSVIAMRRCAQAALYLHNQLLGKHSAVTRNKY
jgi:hypothetical protein